MEENKNTVISFCNRNKHKILLGIGAIAGAYFGYKIGSAGGRLQILNRGLFKDKETGNIFKVHNLLSLIDKYEMPIIGVFEKNTKEADLGDQVMLFCEDFGIDIKSKIKF